MNPTRTITALTITLACLTAACTTSTDNGADPAQTTTTTPTTTQTPAEPTATPSAPTTTTVATQTTTTEPAAGIDLDNPDLDVDLNAIAELIAADATGDPEWIDVIAGLLAKDWLLTRYPAETDPLSVYSRSWADEVATENRALFVENGWYRISDVPQLLSAERTREVGGLTELRVHLFREPARVMAVADDSVVNPSLGGTGPEGSSGLFKLGAPEDGTSGWRIYRIDQIDNTPDGGDA